MKRWRWIALLLCALLTVSVFAACETKPQAESSTVSVDGPVGMTKQLLDHLGERDLGVRAGHPVHDRGICVRRHPVRDR